MRRRAISRDQGQEADHDVAPDTLLGPVIDGPEVQPRLELAEGPFHLKNLSQSARAKLPEVPWRQMAGSRDRLIHDYSGVNIDIVWQIAHVELRRDRYPSV